MWSCCSGFMSLWWIHYSALPTTRVLRRFPPLSGCSRVIVVDVFSETITITQNHLRLLINTGIVTALHMYMYMALMRANQLMAVVCHLPSSGPPDLSVHATCANGSFYDSNIAKK